MQGAHHARLQHWAKHAPSTAAIQSDHQIVTYQALADQVASLPQHRDGPSLVYSQTSQWLEHLARLIQASRDGFCYLLGLDQQAAAEQLAKTLSATEVGQPSIQNPALHTAFYASFTSGSSGTPKCFFRDEASWLQSYQHLDRFVGTYPSIAVATGAAHSMGVFFALWALHRGKSVHFDSLAADVWVGTPTHLELCYQALSKQPPKVILLGGSAISTAQINTWQNVLPNTQFLGFYGASELSFVSIYDLTRTKPSSVGLPLDGVDIRIRDDHEIWVRSSQRCLGYLNAELLEDTDGFIYVGDQGKLRENGELDIFHRIDAIKVAGKLLYPAQIEAALQKHAAVIQVAVKHYDDPLRGQRVTAHAVSSASVAALKQHLVTELGEAYRSVHIHIADALPKLASGKINYGAL
ncbi:MAG: long-chain fatty acid--CoA ligase [Gammaproteobacteria bacterium]|nr:long-chain fatty acid--CoA ligase [Gammaproteobacteria bacterium]